MLEPPGNVTVSLMLPLPAEVYPARTTGRGSSIADSGKSRRKTVSHNSPGRGARPAATAHNYRVGIARSHNGIAFAIRDRHFQVSRGRGGSGSGRCWCRCLVRCWCRCGTRSRRWRRRLRGWSWSWSWSRAGCCHYVVTYCKRGTLGSLSSGGTPRRHGIGVGSYYAWCRRERKRWH